MNVRSTDGARRVGMLLSAFAVGACAGEGFDVSIPSQIALITDTDGQQVPAGGRIPNALAVMVTAEDGTPAPRAEVAWTIVEGTGASLSDPVTLSDGTGRAEVSLTLGPVPGMYVVRAALGADPGQAVLFSAEGTSPPQLSVVVPDRFAAGDTVVLQGGGFRGVSLLEVPRVEIGGTLAQVVVVSTTGLALSVEVPPCLAPGPVPIRVLVNSASSNLITGTYEASSAPVQLAVGQYASIDPALLAGCATFPDAEAAGAEYLLVPQSVTGVPGVYGEYRLVGDSVVTMVPAPARQPSDLPLALRFHTFLRGREAEIARLPKPPMAEAPAAIVAAAQIQIGDKRDFRVCDKITCSKIEDFAPVTAEAKYVGTHAAIYQDLAAPAPCADGNQTVGCGLSASDFMTLGMLFDQELYTVASRAFGVESDVDRNGRVIILMTPIVNALTPTEQCDASIVIGFFFALDIDPAFQGDARSNKGEVFYTLTADPSGEVTCAHSADRIRRLVMVTLIHELQHMISYNQHVLVRGGNSESVWLNEAMSHLAEELAALHFEGLGDQELFSLFAIGNLFDAYGFLKAPSTHFTLYSDGLGTLSERGAAWLFVRWLVDQFGEGVIRRLSETAFTGADNVGAATGEPFARLMAEAFLAHYVSDLPNFTAPPRLQHLTWRFRTTYGLLNQELPERFDLPFPIVPPQFNGGAFLVLGALRSGSGDYYRVVQSAGQRGFTIRMGDIAGAPLGDVTVPRLNIVRIR